MDVDNFEIIDFDGENLENNLKVLDKCVKDEKDIIVNSEEEEWIILGKEKVVIQFLYGRYGEVERYKWTIDEVRKDWKERFEED